MTLDEFLTQPVTYAGRQDELELWSQRTFKQQMQDVYGEAARLVKYHREAPDKLAAQWDVFDRFCTMAILDPSATEGERQTVRLAAWELWDYLFGENTFRNSETSVMRWFNQWVFDVNYADIAK